VELRDRLLAGRRLDVRVAERVVGEDDEELLLRGSREL
jgi:hypothetical protein